MEIQKKFISESEEKIYIYIYIDNQERVEVASKDASYWILRAYSAIK